PTFFNHWVTVPSVTLSPESRSVSEVAGPEDSLLGEEGAAGSGSDSAVGSVAGSDSVAGSVEGSDWAEESSVSPSSSPSAPMRAISAPMSTVSSSSTRILVRTPATGDGISVSTLSVETSRSGSSTSTVSPTFFNHWVTVPSLTLSPRAGWGPDVGMVPHWIWARYLPEVCRGSADVTGAGRWARPWVVRSVVHVQRFARQSKVCLAQCFRLARVWVNELRDLRG